LKNIWIWSYDKFSYYMNKVKEDMHGNWENGIAKKRIWNKKTKEVDDYVYVRSPECAVLEMFGSYYEGCNYLCLYFRCHRG